MTRRDIIDEVISKRFIIVKEQFERDCNEYVRIIEEEEYSTEKDLNELLKDITITAGSLAELIITWNLEGSLSFDDYNALLDAIMDRVTELENMTF